MRIRLGVEIDTVPLLPSLGDGRKFVTRDERQWQDKKIRGRVWNSQRNVNRGGSVEPRRGAALREG